MQESLRNRTISGMLWAGIGKVGALGISFITNMVLARLLLPSDFGCIAMLYVFIAISGIFVNGGLGSALIQKKEPTHIDYTTVFYWNIVMSVLSTLSSSLRHPPSLACTTCHSCRMCSVYIVSCC